MCETSDKDPDATMTVQAIARVRGPTPGSVWRHYKGGLYTVVACAVTERGGEPVVVYRSHAFGYVWTRPLTEWNEIVSYDGQRRERFAKQSTVTPVSDAESVVREWVASLQFKEQSILLLALRGCDTAAKHGPGKDVTRALRRLVLKNAMAAPDTFMARGTDAPLAPPLDQGAVDGYPHHWIMHLIHAAEIVGYRYPGEAVASSWRGWYRDACAQLHVTPESDSEMTARLAGDHGPKR